MAETCLVLCLFSRLWLERCSELTGKYSLHCFLLYIVALGGRVGGGVLLELIAEARQPFEQW